ncbi:MAG TPA: peroxiredoxin [Acidimicrobiales bacterium]|jgi:peroxiredoxin|nr:peroxiredoxin [Acidimicrobiales bacterium]
MTIAVGDKLPDVALQIMRTGERGPKTVQTADVLGRGKVVLFGVPGAFTPTCSDYHLPGYVTRAGDLKARGVDTIACVSVNDAFVMEAWGREHKVGSDIVMLGDGNGEFTAALGLDSDLSDFGLGSRSKRYALVIEDGVVTGVHVETKPGLDVSSAESVMATL